MASPIERGSPPRTPAQRERILRLLRERGPEGVSNVELNQVGYRYGARLWELRKQGFSIQTIREGESLSRFVLVSEPEQPKRLPKYCPGPRQERLALFQAARA